MFIEQSGCADIMYCISVVVGDAFSKASGLQKGRAR